VEIARAKTDTLIRALAFAASAVRCDDIVKRNGNRIEDGRLARTVDAHEDVDVVLQHDRQGLKTSEICDLNFGKLHGADG